MRAAHVVAAAGRGPAAGHAVLLLRSLRPLAVGALAGLAAAAGNVRAETSLSVTWQRGSATRDLSWTGTCGSAYTVYRTVGDACAAPVVAATGVTGTSWQDGATSPGIDQLVWYQVGCEDAGSPALPDSNRAFAVERAFSVVPGFRNRYVLSVPTMPGLADLGGQTPSKGCVADGTTPDGVLTTLDVICSFWDGTDQLTVGRFDPVTSAWVQLRGLFVLGRRRFSGRETPLVPGEALLLDAAGSGVNRGFITGVEDPSFAGMPVAPAPAVPASWQLRPLSVREDALSRTADAILCGEPNVDWVDADADGAPDSCPNGIFDGTHPISVETFDNVPSGSPTDNRWVARSVQLLEGRLLFLGTNFTIAPGEGALVHLDVEHEPTTFLPAHCEDPP